MTQNDCDSEFKSAESRWGRLSMLLQQPQGQVNCDATATALRDLATELRATRQQVSMQGGQGAADWLAFETDLWQVSEAVRTFLKQRRDIRGSNPVLVALASIVQDSHYGKGRQNIVLILGEFGQGLYGETLGNLLSDPEVQGHAIQALLKCKSLDYKTQVSAILKSTEYGWIRRAAKRYLAAAEGP